MDKEIKNLLFPQLKVIVKDNETYYIDESVDSNILACIEDIKGGYKDEVLLKTLTDIQKRLTKARLMLEVESPEIKSSGHYIVRS